MLLQFLIYGLINGSLVLLIALSFDLIYSTTKIFHLAHAGIYTLCSYFLLTFFKDLQINLLLSILIALILSGLTGLIIESVFYYPSWKKKLKGGVYIITAIGLYTVIINLIALFYGNETKIILSGIRKSYTFGNIIITDIQFFQFFIPIVIILIVFLFLKFTNTGRDIKALTNNPGLLNVLGANLRKIRILIFFACSIIAGISAILTSLDVGMDPYVGISVLLNGVVAMIIGGRNNFLGIVSGSYILTLTQAIVIYKVPSKWEPLITFTILILVLLFKPEGLFIKKKRIEIGETQ